MIPWLYRMAAGCGLAVAARSLLARSGVFVLELHGVASRAYPELPPALRPVFTAQDLERTLSWLAPRFAFLTPEEAFRPDARGVLLTFDDGFANNLHQALPLLERFRAPAVYFVTLQLVEEPGRRLPWVEEALAAAGEEPEPQVSRDLFEGLGLDGLRRCAAHPLLSLGSHSLTHPRLTGCDDAALRREVEVSRRRLAELSGRPVDLFAYPYGDYDRRVAEAVRGAGYRAAFAEDSRGVGRPAFEIPRVGLYASAPAYLDLKLSGLHRRPWRSPSRAGKNHG